MSKPTVRVLALLELLQSHGQLSGSELARRLEVDGRTLRRYIVALEELGIPISAERGRHGGYRLVAGFKLPPLMFSAEETLAVSSACWRCAVSAWAKASWPWKARRPS